MKAASRLTPFWLLALLCCPSLVFSGEPNPQPTPLPAVDPKTPLADLLPAAPKTTGATVYLGDDLSRVPEVMFEAPPAPSKARKTTPQWVRHQGRTMAAVLHLNAKEEDGFLKALLRSRPDLAGMPFLMGK